jgi:hypothetical protein
MEADVGALAALLSKRGNTGYRRYQWKCVDGRLMLVRDEVDRVFDLVMSEVCGVELEPDERDGTFLDLDRAWGPAIRIRRLKFLGAFSGSILVAKQFGTLENVYRTASELSTPQQMWSS